MLGQWQAGDSERADTRGGRSREFLPERLIFSWRARVSDSPQRFIIHSVISPAVVTVIFPVITAPAGADIPPVIRAEIPPVIWADAPPSLIAIVNARADIPPVIVAAIATAIPLVITVTIAAVVPPIEAAAIALSDSCYKNESQLVPQLNSLAPDKWSMVMSIPIS